YAAGIGRTAGLRFGLARPALTRPATFRCIWISVGAAARRRRSARIRFRNAQCRPYPVRGPQDTPAPPFLPASLRAASRRNSAPRGASRPGGPAADSLYAPPANALSAAERGCRIFPLRYESLRETHTSPSPSQI